MTPRLFCIHVSGLKDLNSKKARGLFFLCLFFIFGCSGSISLSGKDYRVRQVIDGDTIELEDGRKVRYIGIDTPETGRRKGDGWVYEPAPYADKAKELNRQMVDGKLVRLELDVQKTDKYGRLLAYCFSGDAFVNARMLEEGLAILYTSPPNVRYAELLVNAQEDARRNNRGLWGGIQIVQAKDAGGYLNQIVTVEGRVSSVYQSPKVNILNFGRSDFKAVIFKEEFPVFMSQGISIRQDYKGRIVRITGKVREYKDDFEIVVRHPSAIEVVD